MEPEKGIEPSTSPLPRVCSTPELPGQPKTLGTLLAALLTSCKHFMLVEARFGQVVERETRLELATLSLEG
jgi:hypothetical protein